MEKIDNNWFSQGLIDFEYKKYFLLAYLQAVSKRFDARTLYPFFADLIVHHQNLTSFIQAQHELKNNFPKSIERDDFQAQRFEYKEKYEIVQNELITLEEIVHFAIPKIAFSLRKGKALLEEIEEKIAIEPIGIAPIDFREGYVFLHQQPLSDAKIYTYKISIFENSHETLRGIHLKYLEAVPINLGTTYQQLKLQLVKKNQNLPNPATFLVRANVQCPFEETLLPITKRRLIQFISVMEKGG